MNWREHPPEHFHAVYGEHEALMTLDGQVYAVSWLGRALSMVRDPAVFVTAVQHPVMRTVAWDNGADLAPE